MQTQTSFHGMDVLPITCTIQLFSIPVQDSLLNLLICILMLGFRLTGCAHADFLLSRFSYISLVAVIMSGQIRTESMLEKLAGPVCQPENTTEGTLIPQLYSCGYEVWTRFLTALSLSYAAD